MRFLHKLYFDSASLAVLYMSFQDSEAMEDGEAEDARVFGVIGNDPTTVTVLVWSEANEDVEAQLRGGMVPVLSTYEEEGETRVRLDFRAWDGAMGETAAGAPSYGDLVAALEELGVSIL